MGIVNWFKRRIRRRREVVADEGTTTRAFDAATTGGFGSGTRSGSRDDPFAPSDR